jgi:type VI secretion system protein ImpM
VTVVGLFGKLPAHGDFVRRGLPVAFCDPLDNWLAASVAAARDALGDGFEAIWDAAPAWRFALPPGACGPQAAAGVLLCSRDAVGRRFPLVVAAVRDPATPWPAAWFAALEGAALVPDADADALLATLPAPGEGDAAAAPAAGWWTADPPGLAWDLPALPPPTEFALLLEPAP